MEGNRFDILANPLLLIGGIVFAIGFLVFAIAGFTSVGSAAFGPPDMSGVVGGWLIAAVGMILMIASKWTVRSMPIPPPPPIQQPMVPAGAQGPLALNCPACGAPAQDVDRFGIAVCTHCNTRFLVR